MIFRTVGRYIYPFNTPWALQLQQWFHHQSKTNGYEESAYIYPLTKPEVNREWKFPTTFTLFSSNPSCSNFGIGGPVASTTPMTILSIQFVLGFGFAVDNSNLDEHLYWRFGHHHLLLRLRENKREDVGI